MNTRQIRSMAYCQDFEKAINMLCDVIEKQDNHIKDLKEQMEKAVVKL